MEREGGAWSEPQKDCVLKPDMISCNAALSVCEKGERWERSLKLLSEAKELTRLQKGLAAVERKAKNHQRREREAGGDGGVHVEDGAGVEADVEAGVGAGEEPGVVINGRPWGRRV